MKQILFILAFLLTTFLARVEGARECPVHTCSVLLYDPLCAKQSGQKKSRSFGNDCELDRTNCDAKPKYVIIYKGLCDSDK